MTPDQMAELAARLRKHAKPLRRSGQMTHDHIADDLDRAAELIESMAQRVPLTDEQIWELWVYPPDMSWKESVIMLGRAIEQAHGIRSEK